MILKINRFSIEIVPSSNRDERELDVAFIEEVLGLKNDGDYVHLVRKNAHGVTSMGRMEATKR